MDNQGFNVNHMMALKELILGDEEADQDEMVQNYNKGSVLNPGDINSDGKKKDLAKPFSKIEIKTGEKPQQQQPQQQQQEQPKKKKAKDPKDIWNEDEVSELPISKNETRRRPETETLYKQTVGTEDVFLGMNGMDPTSTKCQAILVKIFMPDTKFKEVSLDVTKEAMVVQSPLFYLHHIFPYPVKEKEGKAQWISDKCILQLTLPIIREQLW